MFCCEFKATCPASQIIPLQKGSPIDGQPEFDSNLSSSENFPPQLQVGVLGVLQVGEHLLHQPGKVFPIDKVVRLHENLPGKMLGCYSTMSTCYSTNCVAQCQQKQKQKNNVNPTSAATPRSDCTLRWTCRTDGKCSGPESWQVRHIYIGRQLFRTLYMLLF